MIIPLALKEVNTAEVYHKRPFPQTLQFAVSQRTLESQHVAQIRVGPTSLCECPQSRERLVGMCEYPTPSLCNLSFHTELCRDKIWLKVAWRYSQMFPLFSVNALIWFLQFVISIEM